MKSLRTIAIGACIALASSTVAIDAHAVVIGTPSTTSPNGFPFNADFFGVGTRYQQVYDDAAFGGPITISAISFFSGRGTLNSGTYTLSLSHSVNPVDALSHVFDDNVGSDATLFGVFQIGGPSPSTLTFLGAPFFYDGVGDLLLDMQVALDSVGAGDYEARSGDADGLFSRMHNFGEGFVGIGLVTGFVDVSEIVAPGTLALLAYGLAGLGFSRRRSK